MKSSSEAEPQNMSPSARGEAQGVTPSPEKTTGKKPYSTPVLKVYGNVGELTKTAGTVGLVLDTVSMSVKTA